MKVRVKVELQYKLGFSKGKLPLLHSKLINLINLVSLKRNLSLNWKLENDKLLILLKGNEPDDVRLLLDDVLVALRESGLDAEGC